MSNGLFIHRVNSLEPSELKCSLICIIVQKWISVRSGRKLLELRHAQTLQSFVYALLENGFKTFKLSS